ncbi:MAG: hypothetical protein K2O97_04085 [Acetatifactor sp.]|nr:hypothetical protein [Acetatifactor sp.]MDE7044188.1 hypothetical protein [Acetatifactor sp.]
MRRFGKSEQGTAMVEATLMLPFCMIMIVGVLYAALYLCQKANIQSDLETALLYYKAAESDTYVEAKTQMEYDGNGLEAVGSNYGTVRYLNPYRFFFMKFKEGDYRSFFRSICGHMFFDTGDNVSITAQRHNYVFYKTIEATATQTVKPPVNLSWVGGPEKMIIEVTGEIVINDGDDFIRNVDFAIDMLADTEMGRFVQGIGQKAKDIYDKFKEVLHVGDEE